VRPDVTAYVFGGFVGVPAAFSRYAANGKLVCMLPELVALLS